MSKLSLFIQNQVIDNNITKEKNLINHSSLYMEGHFSGEIVVPASGTKVLYMGTTSYVFVSSDKNTKITLNGNIEVNIKPLQNGSQLVEGMFCCSGVFTSVEVENTSTEDAVINFFITE